MSAPSKIATARSRTDSIPLESQGARRRAQLVRAAASLIDSKGVDSMRMADVAKVAGCSRQVVHGYFARREDLLRAVAADFETILEQKLGSPAGLVMSPENFGPERLAAWGRLVAGAAWDLLEEHGLAGLFLVASPHVGHDVMGPVETVRRPFVERWMGYIEQVVPTRTDAEMIVELWMATFYRLALKWRAGEITREQGNELLIRYCVSILEGLTSYR